MTSTLDVMTALDDVVLLVPEFERVSESTRHVEAVDLLFHGLAARFADAEDVAVFRDLAWFPDRRDTRVRLDPDVMSCSGAPRAIGSPTVSGSRMTRPRR